MADKKPFFSTGTILWSIVIVAAFGLIYLQFFTCHKEPRVAAWAAFDKTVKKAAHDRGKQTSSYNDLYIRQYMDAEELRKKSLEECHCPPERPMMDEEDVELERAKMAKLEESLLIKAGLSYSLNNRAVDSTGAAYNFIWTGSKVVYAPIASMLSEDGIRQLRNTPDPITALAQTGETGLKEEYQPLLNYDGPEFMKELESLHDKPENWSEDGLSVQGDTTVSAICSKFQLDKGKVFHAINIVKK